MLTATPSLLLHSLTCKCNKNTFLFFNQITNKNFSSELWQTAGESLWILPSSWQGKISDYSKNSFQPAVHPHSKFIIHSHKFCTQEGLKNIKVLSTQKTIRVRTYLVKPTLSHQFSLATLWIFSRVITCSSIFPAPTPVNLIHGGFLSFDITKNS